MQDRLGELPTEYDLVVVGGGINGAGVARDAALRGYRVALVERGDFGAGTSSRTSKLVHGGVRYLEHGAFHLVWEASRERRLLLRLAPHLVRPLPFVFPVFREARFGTGRLRAGMLLYDLLAAFRNVHSHRMLSLRRSATWREGLREDGLRGAALYWDAAMDDARLVLANVRGARAAGAEILNRAAATLRFDGGTVTGIEVHDLESGARATWRSACVVACTGPWTNGFLAVLPGAPRPLATTRGSHIVVRKLSEQAFTLAAGRDGRVFFVLPWLGATLIGTTDVEDGGDPDRVAPSEEEIGYLLAEANRAFPSARLDRSDVQAAFAGLRPLLRASGTASARSREHALLEPAPGLFAVAGGKYTTYRAVAEQAVDRLGRRIGRRGACRTRGMPLPGGDLAWSAAEHWNEGPRFMTQARDLAARARVAAETARRWLAIYGSEAQLVADRVAVDPTLAAPLCPHHPHTRAEVLHAVQHEMALHLEDWFLRRSRTAFTACNGIDAIEPVAQLFAAALGWSDADRRRDIEACRARLAQVASRSHVETAPAPNSITQERRPPGPGQSG